MKKLLLIITVIAFASCGSPEKNAQSVIKQYLKVHLNDPKSYEPVSFGSLDSLYSNLRTDGFLDSLDSDIESNKALTDGYFNLTLQAIRNGLPNAKDYEDKWRSCEAADSILRVHQDNYIKSFKSDFIGWSMAHTYRAKNGFGALGIETQIFYLDKNITAVQDINESE